MSLAIRQNWTEEEDSAVRMLVAEHGTTNWTLISRELANKFSICTRSGKQIRERWNNHLNPSLDKSPWSSEEDSKILELWKELGKSWTAIASHFPGRSENSVKNRFYSTMRKKLRDYNRVRQYSERFTGSIRTLLRNTSVLNKLFADSTQPSTTTEEALTIEAPAPIKADYLCSDSPILPNCPNKHPVILPSPHEDVNLLFNLSNSHLSYFFFYPQASSNYKINLPSLFPSFL